MQRRESGMPNLAEDEHWRTIKRLVAGVRQHGSYKRYAQRGKLSTNDSVLNFLARLGDNGVVWHILGYWRATD